MSYLRYILRHKWYVFLECHRLGIPWLGIIHDMLAGSTGEKYYPRLQNGTSTQPGTAIRSGTSITGNTGFWSSKFLPSELFPFQDDDPDEALPIPDRYRREMLASKPGHSMPQWYTERREKVLHPETREWIEAQLERLS